MMFNVPMNDSLAVVPPHSSEAAALWPRYVTNWTIWNHVRAAAAIWPLSGSHWNSAIRSQTPGNQGKDCKAIRRRPT
jgi:hypothetical protein